MDLPSLKLYYFNMFGKGECIRMILAAGEISYEDYCFERDDWPKLKLEMPYGQVPVLEVEGKKIAQSIAISRYVGNLAKLGGDNALENLLIDSVVDAFTEVQNKIIDMRFGSDVSKREEMKDQILSKTLPYYCKRWDTLAEENGGYIAIKRLTWADILFVCFYEAARSIFREDIFANYPNLSKVKQNVLSVPALRKYLHNRKENKYYSYDLKTEL